MKMSEIRVQLDSGKWVCTYVNIQRQFVALKLSFTEDGGLLQVSTIIHTLRRVNWNPKFNISV